MPLPSISDVVDLARTIAGPPYDPDGSQPLCNILEQILAAHLEGQPTWPRHDWLDGFLATELERDSDRVTIRGGIWVSAVRPEPCEVTIQLDEPQGATFRFMDADRLSEAPGPWRLRFPMDRIWRYSFHLGTSSQEAV